LLPAAANAVKKNNTSATDQIASNDFAVLPEFMSDSSRFAKLIPKFRK